MPTKQQSIFGGKGYLVFFLSLQIADVFSPIPDCTNLKQHDIDTSPGVVLCSHRCSLSEHKKKVVTRNRGILQREDEPESFGAQQTDC